MRAAPIAAALAALALAGCERPSPAASPAPASPGAERPAAPQAAGPAAAPAAEERPWEVALEPPAALRAGERAAARVVVRARGTFHVNRDYPMAFRPEPGSVAAFGAEKVALGEGAARTPCAAHPEEACAVSAPLPILLAAPGPATLGGTVAFSVCNAEVCRIEKVPLTLAVTAAR